MGPIDITFFIVLAIFGAIGLVRGYHRELGVTVMLLITLFVLEFLSEKHSGLLNQGLGFITGADETVLADARALIYTAVLVFVTFVSYEGQTLVFPGAGKNWFFGLGTGLLNGWLFAWSIWYYLNAAGWPLLSITGPFSAAYNIAEKLLPPALFSWPYFVGLAVLLLILRVIR